MSYYTHHCRIQHCFPAQGPPCVGQGPQCITMKHATCITRNHPLFTTRGPEPCGATCEAAGTEPSAPKSPSPCEAKAPEPCDPKGTEKDSPPRSTSCHEFCAAKNLQPPPLERFNLPCPPRCMQPCVTRCPPLGAPQFRVPHGFPASSRCFPPRKMYQYTASKTFKSCYAK